MNSLQKTLILALLLIPVCVFSTNLRFSPSGRYMLDASTDSSVVVYDLLKEKAHKILEIPNGYRVYDLIFSRNERFVLLFGAGIYRVADLVKGESYILTDYQLMGAVRFSADDRELLFVIYTGHGSVLNSYNMYTGVTTKLGEIHIRSASTFRSIEIDEKERLYYYHKGFIYRSDFRNFIVKQEKLVKTDVYTFSITQDGRYLWYDLADDFYSAIYDLNEKKVVSAELVGKPIGDSFGSSVFEMVTRRDTLFAYSSHTFMVAVKGKPEYDLFRQKEDKFSMQYSVSPNNKFVIAASEGSKSNAVFSLVSVGGNKEVCRITLPDNIGDVLLDNLDVVWSDSTHERKPLGFLYEVLVSSRNSAPRPVDFSAGKLDNFLHIRFDESVCLKNVNILVNGRSVVQVDTPQVNMLYPLRDLELMKGDQRYVVSVTATSCDGITTWRDVTPVSVYSDKTDSARIISNAGIANATVGFTMSPAGRYFCIGSATELSVHNVIDGSKLFFIYKHTDEHTVEDATTFSYDDQYFAAVSNDDKKVLVYDLGTTEVSSVVDINQLPDLKRNSAYISHLRFGRSANFLLVVITWKNSRKKLWNSRYQIIDLSKKAVVLTSNIFIELNEINFMPDDRGLFVVEGSYVEIFSWGREIWSQTFGQPGSHPYLRCTLRSSSLLHHTFSRDGGLLLIDGYDKLYTYRLNFHHVGFQRAGQVSLKGEFGSGPIVNQRVIDESNINGRRDYSILLAQQHAVKKVDVERTPFDSTKLTKVNPSSSRSDQVLQLLKRRQEVILELAKSFKSLQAAFAPPKIRSFVTRHQINEPTEVDTVALVQDDFFKLSGVHHYEGNTFVTAMTSDQTPVMTYLRFSDFKHQYDKGVFLDVTSPYANLRFNKTGNELYFQSDFYYVDQREGYQTGKDMTMFPLFKVDLSKLDGRLLLGNVRGFYDEIGDFRYVRTGETTYDLNSARKMGGDVSFARHNNFRLLTDSLYVRSSSDANDDLPDSLYKLVGLSRNDYLHPDNLNSFSLDIVGTFTEKEIHRFPKFPGKIFSLVVAGRHTDYPFIIAKAIILQSPLKGVDTRDFAKEYESRRYSVITYILDGRRWQIVKTLKTEIRDPGLGSVYSREIEKLYLALNTDRDFESSPYYFDFLYVKLATVITVYNKTTWEIVKTIKFPKQMISSCALLPNNNLLLADFETGQILQFDWENEKVVLRAGGDSRYPCLTMSFSQNSRLLATSALNGVISIWKFDGERISEKPVLSFTLYGKDGAVFYNDGYYYTDGEASAHNLSLLQGGRQLSMPLFDAHYNRPDLLVKALFPKDTRLNSYFDPIIQMRKRATAVAAKRVAIVGNPTLKILNEIQSTIKEQSIKLEILTVQNYTVKVWVNDVEDTMMIIDQGKQQVIKIDRRLSAGENNFSIYGFDSDGNIVSAEAFSVFSDNTDYKPNLHVITVGISDYKALPQLSGIIKGQQLFVENIRNGNTSSRWYNSVKHYQLADTEVTESGLQMIHDQLVNTSVNDYVILVVGGHGLYDEASKEFYYPTLNENRGITFDSFYQMLSEIPARQKLFILDACFSGNAAGNLSFEEQRVYHLMRETFKEYSRGNGTVTISAAGGYQYSYSNNAGGILTQVVGEFFVNPQQTAAVSNVDTNEFAELSNKLDDALSQAYKGVANESASPMIKLVLDKARFTLKDLRSYIHEQFKLYSEYIPMPELKMDNYRNNFVVL